MTLSTSERFFLLSANCVARSQRMDFLGIVAFAIYSHIKTVQFAKPLKKNTLSPPHHHQHQHQHRHRHQHQHPFPLALVLLFSKKMGFYILAITILWSFPSVRIDIVMGACEAYQLNLNLMVVHTVPFIYTKIVQSCQEDTRIPYSIPMSWIWSISQILYSHVPFVFNTVMASPIAVKNATMQSTFGVLIQLHFHLHIKVTLIPWNVTLLKITHNVIVVGRDCGNKKPLDVTVAASI